MRGEMNRGQLRERCRGGKIQRKREGKGGKTGNHNVVNDQLI